MADKDAARMQINLQKRDDGTITGIELDDGTVITWGVPLEQGAEPELHPTQAAAAELQQSIRDLWRVIDQHLLITDRLVRLVKWMTKRIA